MKRWRADRSCRSFPARCNNTGRRSSPAVIGLLLIVALFVGVDWRTDVGRDSIGGTICYFALTLTSLAVAAWGRSVGFDKEHGEVRQVKILAGIEVKRSVTPLAAVRSVPIQGMRFLKESEQPQTGLLNTRFRTHMNRRNNYYKLFLETDDQRMFLEDSTELSDLDVAAAQISEFLGMTFRREDI